MHTPSFCLSGRLPLGVARDELSVYTMRQFWLVSLQAPGVRPQPGRPGHGLTSVGGASFPPPLTPELQGCGLESSQCGLESSQWGVQNLWAWWDHIQGGKLGLVVEAGITGACGLLSGDLGPGGGIRRDTDLKLSPVCGSSNGQVWGLRSCHTWKLGQSKGPLRSV